MVGQTLIYPYYLAITNPVHELSLNSLVSSDLIFDDRT